eukprot:TRINITY_DN2598_c0_g1_i1.p1 TRINITY_DN2598_c0_g1~~TRINITY_DN2598_c0_g1_i1.p1  ORF type:complete len:461 (-),score=82.87 TRINITY_DN2598_c0_g1_i1:521-1882(-)
MRGSDLSECVFGEEVEFGQYATLKGGDAFYSANFSPDGERLLCAMGSGAIEVYEVKDGNRLRTYSGHRGNVYEALWILGGQSILSCGEDSSVRIWEVESGTSRVFEGHKKAVACVAVSPDNLRAASVSKDKTVRLWNLQSGICERVLEGHTGEVHSVAFSRDGAHLVTGGDTDFGARVWNIATGDCEHVFEGHTRILLGLAFSPDGRVLATSAYDGTIRVWDYTSRACMRIITTKGRRVTFVDQNRLLVANDNNMGSVWNVATGFCERTLEGQTNSVLAVGVSPNGKLVSTASYDCTIRLWNLQNSVCERLFDGHKNYVQRLSFSATGRQLASASSDNTVYIWDSQTGERERSLQDTEQVMCVRFSPAGDILAAGGWSRAVRIWNPTNGQCLHVLEGHTNPIMALDFSADGKKLLSSSSDSTIRMWDVGTGHPIRVFSVHFSLFVCRASVVLM